MEISEAELRERYQSLSTDELINLRSKNTLTELASRILDNELDRRGLSIQDKERLSQEFLENTRNENRADAYFASLGERFVAQIIDSIITGLIMFTGALLTNPGNNAPGMAGLCLGLTYLWLSDALPNGQSIGKHVMKISVIDTETGKPCTIFQSFIRNFLLSVLGIIDCIFIVGKKRQRLGDMAATTSVIKVKRVTA
jgi:uncharacterized RDD family membrane protein YckC